MRQLVLAVVATLSTACGTWPNADAACNYHNQVYRVAQLDGLDVYRVERLTPSLQWQPVWPNGMGEKQHYQNALFELEDLRAEDRTRAARCLGNWHEVEAR